MLFSSAIGLSYMRLRLKQVKGHLSLKEAHKTYYGLHLDINYLFFIYIYISLYYIMVKDELNNCRSQE